MDGNTCTNDATLLRSAQQGDRSAFAVLYRRHGPSLFALALRTLGDRSAAEDVVHDVFLRALDQLKSVRDADRVGAWLKRSAANACIDQIRQRRPQVGAEAALAALPDQAAAIDVDIPAALLDSLPTTSRALVWLFVVEGWTHHELAARFGRSESWSKSIVSRSLARLRLLSQHTPEDSNDATL